MNPPPDSTLADPQRIIADLQHELANAQRELIERTAQRDEALSREVATAEVLGVINSSPGDLAPVFDAMLDRAVRLCEAAYGMLYSYEDGAYRTIAVHNLPPAYEQSLQGVLVPLKGNALGRLASGERIVHIPDLRADEAYRARDPIRVASVELGGARTYVAIPLLKDEVMVGAIAAYRQEVRPFTGKHIALLENFAAQAVIAMENARLLSDLRERTDDLQQSLEYQTATSDVLKVISRSTFDLQPVLDTLVETAARLCSADGSGIALRDGDIFHYATLYANYGIEEYSAFLRQRPFVAGRDTTVGRVALEGNVVHIADITADPEYALPQSATAGGIRTNLGVPLLRDGIVTGMLTLFRQRVEPFSDREIELVKTFADQAVIAIENTRLITETREALDQQTATAEVLGVINSSPGDLTPVFDAILEKALLLCGGAFGILNVFDGERFNGVAMRGVPPAFAEFRQGNPAGMGPGTAPARILAGENVVNNLDLKDEEPYRTGDPYRRAIVDLGGARSHLAVALRTDSALRGMLTIYRQEVRAFSVKEIALLQNFAAQAVIAMENARLITETREALEQQTATAEVLGVINSSPGDLTPVFQSMLERATRLCESTFGHVWSFDGEQLYAVAAHGDSVFVEWLQQHSPVRPIPGSAADRIAQGEDFVHVADRREEAAYRNDATFRALVDTSGIRASLSVALRRGRDKALLGIVNVYRQEVRPFSDKQIALLQNFAAQAVIAMENARLITETREALEQQTATAEILGVINSSPGDLQPVFEAILENAHRLCGIVYGSLQLYDGEKFRAVAVHGLSEALADHLRQGYSPGLKLPVSRLLEGERFAHVADLAEIDDPMARRVVELGGTRTVLWVALRKDERLLGTIAAARLDVRPFTEKEIALLESFAAQAVIAMENARLLGEIRQRQAELRVTFDNMGDGVVMFDAEHRLAAWNRNFQELLDLPDAVLAERPSYADYLRLLAERGEFGTDDVEAELARRLRDTDQELRLERARPDGRVIEVRRNAVPDGGFVLIYSDITERKRSEAEIRAARDAAEAAYRDLKAAQANLIQAEKMASLGQLTAGIAHEIKNPLNFVNNFASLSVELLDELKETTAPALVALGEEKRSEADETIDMLSGNLEKIAEHGKRADNIVKSMLEHSRGVSGERREVDLNNLIEEALNLAYHGARAQNQDFNITLERDYAASLKPIELAPQEITRVFLNLFGNGFYAANKRARANGDGSFHPILAVATREAEDAVEVRVRDNGTGIAPEIRDKLFQPFFTTKPTGEGTGLGLSISYDIITQQHGGTITVESEPGSFTEFVVRLPRQ